MHTNLTLLVDKRVGSAYQVVEYVSRHVKEIQYAVTNMEHVYAVSTNMAKIIAVQTNTANIDILATEILNPASQLMVVAPSIANVNIVGDNIVDVNTVAANLVGIQTTVANLAAILDADNQALIASNAATAAGDSATLAGTRATTAGTHANTASQAAVDSVAAKDLALTYRDTASSQAGIATTGATTATTQASLAETARIAAEAAAVLASGSLVDVQVFGAIAAPGSDITWTKPVGLPANAKVRIRVQGAGGSSASVSSTSGNVELSWGGGAGAFVEAVCLASALGATEPLRVGFHGTPDGVPGSESGQSSYFGAGTTFIDAAGGGGFATALIPAGSSIAWTGDYAGGVPSGGAVTTTAGAAWEILMAVGGGDPSPGIRFNGSSFIVSQGGQAFMGHGYDAPSSAAPNQSTGDHRASAGNGARGSAAKGLASMIGGEGGYGLIIIEVYA